MDDESKDTIDNRSMYMGHRHYVIIKENILLVYF